MKCDKNKNDDDDDNDEVRPKFENYFVRTFE